MKINQKLKLVTAISAGLALAGCGALDDDDSSSSSSKGLTKSFSCTDVSTSGERVICIGSENDLSDETVQTELKTAIEMAETGDTFVFPQGRYNLTDTLNYNGQNALTGEKVSNLTFRGAGIDKTIFDVSGASADGFLFNNTDNLIFEDFGVYESNNNAIKVTKSDGVIMRRVATVWETDFQETNGAYGLYPVETSNVLIEDCYVQGSADAGVYVGQSDNIVVRNNQAVKNVAGIEIENSTNADVYGNTAIGNTGGILVFDLPIGNGKYGSGVRVFDNIVEDNNAPNFAKIGTNPGGVHIVPPGTGVIILSTSDVEINNNTIKNHQTLSVAVTSFMLPDDGVAATPNQDVGGLDGNDETTPVLSYGDIHPYATQFLDGWSPFVRNINIFDNEITNDPNTNDPQGTLITEIVNGYHLLQIMTGTEADNKKAQLPNILYDGIGELLINTEMDFDPTSGASTTFLQAVAGGVDQVAQALDANGLESDGRRVNLANFLPYTDEDRVCEYNNGDGITSAAVFPRVVSDPSKDFNASTGQPVSNVEQLKVTAINDDSMDCSGITKQPLAAAKVEFGTQEFGCGIDDTTSTFCQ